MQTRDVPGSYQAILELGSFHFLVPLHVPNKGAMEQTRWPEMKIVYRESVWASVNRSFPVGRSAVPSPLFR